MSYVHGDVVVLDYNDLVNGKDLAEQIEKAYSLSGIGVLTVKNVPGFVEARKRLLPLSRDFATLPEEVKEKYVHKDSYYSFGWSHGKESLQGAPDVSKGSYYGNPQYDRPIEDEKIIAEYPSFVHPNIWPTDDLPELEQAFKSLGQIIVQVGELVARQCDAYASSKCPTYSKGHFENVIKTSKCCKARLLHYFPIENAGEIESIDDFSNWCGWHNDHGSLTGLTSAMFIDKDGNIIENTDPNAGLYARSRTSELIKIGIPVDHIGFQIGETAQVHTGGILQATPHAVRGSNIPGVSRETFAVFMEPMWMEPMVCPSSIEPSSAQSQSSAANLPKGVPPLAARWKASNGTDEQTPQTFGEFSEATHKFYY